MERQKVIAGKHLRQLDTTGTEAKSAIVDMDSGQGMRIACNLRN